MALTRQQIFPNPVIPVNDVPAPGIFKNNELQNPYADDFFNGAIGTYAPFRQIDVLDIMPEGGSATSVAPAVAYLTANAHVPLITSSTNGNTVQTIEGQTAILLDCPRNIGIAISAAIGTAVTWTVRGLDICRNPMTETITTPIAGAAQVVEGNKAFWCVFSVSGSHVLAGGITVSVGCGITFGFSTALISKNYLQTVSFDGVNLYDFASVVNIPNGSNTTDVSMILPTSLVDCITLTYGAVPPAVVVNQSNSLYAIVTGESEPFDYTVNCSVDVTADTPIYVAISFNITGLNGMVTAADTTLPATATTGDTRGTISFGKLTDAVFNGTYQVTASYYVRGTDSLLDTNLVATGQAPLTQNDLIGVPQFSG